MSRQLEVGMEGEVLVREELAKMLGRGIAGYFRTSNLICVGRQVQIDFLVLVPGLGLLLLEVKNWKGTIRASAEEKWEREVPNYINKFANASLQVLRASGILLHLLEQERINKWPIRSLVVFAHMDSTVIVSVGEAAPQTDVVKLSGLADWIHKGAEIGGSVNAFKREDFERVKAVLVKYAEPYQERKIFPGDGEVVL